jgi:hypothetical protein
VNLAFDGFCGAKPQKREKITKIGKANKINETKEKTKSEQNEQKLNKKKVLRLGIATYYKQFIRNYVGDTID